MNKIKILDCTLRDGGYYNNWDFNPKLVSNYLQAMESASIDVIELGFRSLPKKTFNGPFLYTGDEFVRKLKLPPHITYGVMINAMEYIKTGKECSKIIKNLFDHCNNSPIDLVRIAINFDKFEEAEPLVEQIKKLGYKIGLNLMQAHGKEENEYYVAAKKISTWNTIDVLYFADSLGNMSPHDIKNICEFLTKNWKHPLGFHSHNNKGFALLNCLEAFNSGVTWCDGTVTGMGRGAGNVTTESLLLELNHLGYLDYNAKSLQSTVDEFTELKNVYGWGPNLYYHYASNNNIHPTFVQNLLDDKRYSNSQTIQGLEFLSKQDSTSFSADSMRRAVYGHDNNTEGTWSPDGWLKDKEILIVGSGPSTVKYKYEIKDFIKSNNIPTVFLNINQNINNKHGIATIVCDEKRALFDSKNYKTLNHPIIMPKSKLAPLLGDRLDDLEIFDFGLNFKEDSFDISSTTCFLGWPLAAAYALAVVLRASPSAIYLVGFDGYSADDYRQDEMNEVFKKFFEVANNTFVSSLTPTTYNINQGSIFSPQISF